MTTIPVFDHTLHVTMEWIRELKQELKLKGDQSAYAALRAVLHQLRDRLSPQEASDISAQLPLLVRGIFYEGWNPQNKPAAVRTTDDFVANVFKELRGHSEIDARSAVKAVFALLQRKVSKGEVQDVLSTLPSDIRAVWPAQPSKPAS